MPRIADRPLLADVMKALSDPIRWSIVIQMAATDELACTTLEHTLPITKAAISYHIKALAHARLLTVRKEGRYYFYKLRRDVLDDALGGIAKEIAEATARHRELSLGSRSAGREPAQRILRQDQRPVPQGRHRKWVVGPGCFFAAPG